MFPKYPDTCINKEESSFYESFQNLTFRVSHAEVYCESCVIEI